MRRSHDQFATALNIVVLLCLFVLLIAVASLVLGVGPLGQWLTELFGGPSAA
jgi:hypothetical protein